MVEAKNLGELLQDACAGLLPKYVVNINVPKVHAPLHFS